MGTPGDRPSTSVALIHLGCEKNLVDSERILGALAMDGHTVCQDPNDADVLTPGYRIPEITRRSESVNLRDIGAPRRSCSSALGTTAQRPI